MITYTGFDVIIWKKNCVLKQKRKNTEMIKAVMFDFGGVLAEECLSLIEQS
ncbi:hypothetical protein BMS3Abin10_02391 [bacterium BMS3Abin10]|nr:hypothetical protein BMS3Abin10_02391 [bacterium BMS3Abin10]GBE38974.1 hypothetical protein BMS3Bbin08_01591 [bacterium BMS3Bbin08]